MKLKSQIELYGYGTSEGVRKEWDERGRSGDVWKQFKNYKANPKDTKKDYGDIGVSTTDFKADAAGGQTDSSSLVGRNYWVVDRYGHAIGEYDNPDEAERAAQMSPWHKVVSKAKATQSQQVRDIARQRLVKTNPDVD